MNNNKKLLEALDYVDVKYVEELVECMKLPKESASAEASKRSLRLSVKYAALIAACALLLGMAIPVAGNLIMNITSGTASSGEPNDLPYVLEEDLQVKEQTEDAFDGSPLFSVVNAEDVCEIYTLDGKKIDFCVCGELPCTCFTGNYFVNISGSNIYYLRQLSGGIRVAACDASDPENIRVVKRNLVGLSTKEHFHDGTFGTETHEFFTHSGAHYFYAYSKEGYTGEYVGLSIIDISGLLIPEDEVIVIRTFSEIGSLRDTSEFLNIGTTWFDIGYFGMKDDSGYINQIGIFEVVEVYNNNWIQPESKAEYKALFEVDISECSDSRVFLEALEDGSVHYYQCEKDDKSENGYSLYQYIYRDGEKAGKVLRAKNVSDYIVSDGGIYYTVNGSGNKIYRLPAFELDYKPLLAVDLGAYEDVRFLQGADGGISVSANKKISDGFAAVTLLIGDGENGTVVTEIAE